MADPVTGELYGRTIHYSVGVILTHPQSGDVLLVSPRNEPYGLAGISGHINETAATGESEGAFTALLREVEQQSRLTIVRHTLHAVCEQFMAGNRCRLGLTGHYWHVYQSEAVGIPVADYETAKNISWYPQADLASLYLEPIWRHWFTRLGMI